MSEGEGESHEWSNSNCEKSYNNKWIKSVTASYQQLSSYLQESQQRHEIERVRGKRPGRQRERTINPNENRIFA